MRYDDDFLLKIAKRATAHCCSALSRYRDPRRNCDNRDGNQRFGSARVGFLVEFLVYFAEEISAKDLLQLQSEDGTIH